MDRSPAERSNLLPLAERVYGGLKGDQVKRLKELEVEDARLRWPCFEHVIAELAYPRDGLAEFSVSIDPPSARCRRYPIRPLSPDHGLVVTGGLACEPQAGRADVAA